MQNSKKELLLQLMWGNREILATYCEYSHFPEEKTEAQLFNGNLSFSEI